MEILQQLGLNSTYFVQLGIFIVLFTYLMRVYFKPFQQLFDKRYRRTVQDQEAADKLAKEASEKLEEYKRALSEARIEGRREYEEILSQAKKQEAEILARARNEAKSITQEAVAEMENQKAALQKELDASVNEFAKSISEKLLAGGRS